MLRKHEGDATELRRLYSNFDPEAVAEDTYGHPYLHEACNLNHFYAVRGLLQCGASLLRKGKFKKTALHRACCGNKESRVDIVAWLLSEHSDARATVNWVTTIGWTGLHISAVSETTAKVRIILEHGGDITLKDNDGKTALDIARKYNCLETTKILGKAEKCLKDLTKVGEWRHGKHSRFPRSYRKAMKTLVVLAKAESN